MKNCTYSLANISIFDSGENLFVTSGDHNLLEVCGAQKQQLVYIIEAFRESKEASRVFEKVSEYLDGDENYFQQFLDFMLENGILYAEESSQNGKTHQIGVFCTSNQTGVMDKFDRMADEFSFKLLSEPDETENLDMVLLVAPMFYKYSSYKKLNQHCWEQSVPLLHFSVEPSAFTLGPLIDRKLDTPCISCYAKRKLVNIRERSSYIEFIRLASGKTVAEHDISQFGFIDAALNFLKIELFKFLRYGGESYSLAGRSITFNAFDYEVRKSRLLKVPGCPVCAVRKPVQALNA